MSASESKPSSVELERSVSPVVLYSTPTAFTLLRTAAINLVLPFINGLMLGFGELFAHEIAFRWGWGTTRVAANQHTPPPATTTDPASNRCFPRAGSSRGEGPPAPE